MKHAERPKTKHNLFPDTWIIGPAAAALAKNDEGVLLAEPPPDSQGIAGETTPVPLHEQPRDALIAELRAENERLWQQLRATRRHLRPMARRVDAFNDALDRDETGSMARRVVADDVRWPSPRPSTGPRAGRSRVALLVLLAVAVLGAAWFTSSQLTDFDGPLGRRVAALQAELGDRLAASGQRLASDWVRAAVPRADGSQADPETAAVRSVKR